MTCPACAEEEREDRSRSGDRRSEGKSAMTAIIPAPTYVLARTAWIPTLLIWRADGRFTHLEGPPCDECAAALAASWLLRPA